ncbi:Na+ dependent nucleoside transporter domain-containing protein [Bacillus pseudomycoides]|nr:Na+ dependent nucleoside transporter domain-containing protein [Bacillus pseudomycoides]
MSLLINIFSIALLFGLLYSISENKKSVKFKPIAYGIAAQLTLTFFFIKIPIGQKAILAFSNGFQKVMSYANDGLTFVFGSLADGKAPTGSIFAIQILCIIIVFSALMSVLYYLGVIGLFVKIIGGAIQKLTGTSKAESFVATANMFLGQTEAPILIKSYLPKMTRSEIFTVLVSGMGSVAGSILVGYNLLGVPMEYLLLACALVPTSSLLVAKILVPETEESELNNVTMDRKGDNTSLVEALAKGTTDGVGMAIGVAGSLIAIISLVAMVNGGLSLIGTSLQEILSYIFLPFGMMFGIPFHEAQQVASLLGQKVTLNEFIAFSDYVKMMGDLSPRASQMVAIALTGFANLSSIGICVVGISVLAPEKRPILSKLAPKAMVGGALVSFLSALFVGLFI